MSFAIAIHVLSATIWVGGMFFAYMALRPVAASLLEPPVRLELWSETFTRFFTWVWAAVILLPATGLWMVFSVFGGMSNVGLHIQIMMGVGIIMILLYLHMYFAPFKRLKTALDEKQYEEAGKRLNQIRKIISINLPLGIFVIVVATAGEFW